MVKNFLICWMMICSCCISFSTAKSNFHPYHVSATEIEFNPKNSTLEISIKIFIDDFENVLKKNYRQKIDLHKAELRSNMDQLIADYVNKHLFVISKNKKYNTQLFGWETNQEAIIIYASAIAPVFDKTNIEVVNTVLFDLFDDQMNIVHFFVDGKRISEKLSIQKPRIKLSY
ncbi:MAG: hypothetical protein E6Q95_05740 [Chitinophagaceae bacterium]|nr:MAG: hypothetical protein E6Q95_05740 [Chitinophagaceae bacterium]